MLLAAPFLLHCNSTLTHSTKLEAPLPTMSLWRWISVYLNPSRWKPCTACCMMDLVFWFEILFLYALMKMVVLRTLWNEPIICMFSTVWTKRFYPPHPKSPRVFSLFQALSFPSLPVNLCISESFFFLVLSVGTKVYKHGRMCVCVML